MDQINWGMFFSYFSVLCLAVKTEKVFRRKVFNCSPKPGQIDMGRYVKFELTLIEGLSLARRFEVTSSKSWNAATCRRISKDQGVRLSYTLYGLVLVWFVGHVFWRMLWGAKGVSWFLQGVFLVRMLVS